MKRKKLGETIHGLSGTQTNLQSFNILGKSNKLHLRMFQFAESLFCGQIFSLNLFVGANAFLISWDPFSIQTFQSSITNTNRKTNTNKNAGIKTNTNKNT